MPRLNRPNVSWQQFQDKMYILTGQSNALHELNGMGSRIFLWLWNEEEISEADLRSRIVEQFATTESQAGEDLAGFLAGLRAKGILLPE
jgi:hypothetical protein